MHPTRLHDVPWQMMAELYGRGRNEVLRRLLDEHLGLTPAGAAPLEQPCAACLARARRRALARLAERPAG
ncbi:hypothetical protein ABZ234_08705 [Nocardiopsis sp. NPDC006198]|uniref:hypothetical protein n=1 Tax=Nocardiopsis sp. NPDC006198 TaxID=3154472 RepID=UPI00339EB4FF